MNPVCVVHHIPMRPSKYPGQFFCPVMVGIGQPGANDKGYCSQKAKFPTPQPGQQQIVAPGASQTPSSANGKDARYAAALNFAALIFRGCGPELAPDALDLARKIVQDWPA